MPAEVAEWLREGVDALVEAGLYDSKEDVLSDALRTLLAARPDLREAVACKLYERGTFSLGRAAEWSGLSIEAMKEALGRCNIARRAPETPEETEEMARRSLK